MTHQMSLKVMHTALKNGKLTNNGTQSSVFFVYIKLGGGDMENNDISANLQVKNLNELKKLLNEALSLVEQLTEKLDELETFKPDVITQVY